MSAKSKCALISLRKVYCTFELWQNVFRNQLCDKKKILTDVKWYFTWVRMFGSPPDSPLNHIFFYIFLGLRTAEMGKPYHTQFSHVIITVTKGTSKELQSSQVSIQILTLMMTRLNSNVGFRVQKQQN